MTFQGPGGQRVGPPSFRCLGLCSPPSKPDSAGLGELYYQHPVCCLYPIQSSVGTHACSGARDGIEPKSGRLEGTNGHFFSFFQFSHSVVSNSVTPWTAACQASLSITNSRSLLKLRSIESVMPSNHFILYRPLLLLPSIFPSIGVFSNESVLRIRWPKYWSLSFNISPSSEYSGLIYIKID